MIKNLDLKPNHVDFDVVTKWELRASPAELTRIVLDTNSVHQWCPSVFLKTKVIRTGRPDNGLGMEIMLHTKGWLPFSFFFCAKIIEAVKDQSMTVSLSGDFEGLGICNIQANGDERCSSTLRWQVNINQPHLRPFLWMLKPIGMLNHSWAVRRIYTELQNEIDRRRDGEEINSPKTATFPHNFQAFRRSWRVTEEKFPPVTPRTDCSATDNIPK